METYALQIQSNPDWPDVATTYFFPPHDSSALSLSVFLTNTHHC